MATTVTNLGTSEQKMIFSGSSEEDQSYAKTFWQSAQLMPPMESRLVSSDIKQRLRRAAPGGQPVNRAHIPREESAALRALFTRAQEQQDAETHTRLMAYSNQRNEDRALLHKHRELRVQKEKIAGRAEVAARPPHASLDIDDKRETAEMQADGRRALEAMDAFDRARHHGNQESDSD